MPKFLRQFATKSIIQGPVMCWVGKNPYKSWISRVNNEIIQNPTDFEITAQRTTGQNSIAGTSVHTKLWTIFSFTFCMFSLRYPWKTIMVWNCYTTSPRFNFLLEGSRLGWIIYVVIACEMSARSTLVVVGRVEDSVDRAKIERLLLVGTFHPMVW